jgi:Protein of unknown function (Hypoth_ymh)
VDRSEATRAWFGRASESRSMQGSPTGLSSYYSDTAECLAESEEALGLVILEILKTYDRANRTSLIRTSLSAGIILNQWLPSAKLDGFALKNAFDMKVEDAWRWLLEHKLIKPDTGYNGQNGIVVLTELGLSTSKDQKALLETSHILPKSLVHPRILARIETDFRQGLYDKAVHDAFKQVEEEVRQTASLDETVSGEQVFKQAFRKGSTLYHRCARPQDELQFFSVSYRMNRHKPAHGNTGFEPAAAARLLVLASHLLFKLDEFSNP